MRATFIAALAAWFSLAGLGLQPGSAQAALRLTAWDVRCSEDPLEASATQLRLEQQIQAIKRADPDILLLQRVQDRRMCDQIIEALKPRQYSIQTCSSFRDPVTGVALKQQSAILAKSLGYFSWFEPWTAAESAGGYAFLAMQAEGVRVGLFSVQLPELALGSTPADAATSQSNALRQVFAQCAKVGKWSANKPSIFLIAASGPEIGNKASFTNRFTRSGFAVLAVGANTAAKGRVSLASQPEVAVLRTAQDLNGDAITCELNLASTRPVASTQPGPSPARKAPAVAGSNVVSSGAARAATPPGEPRKPDAAAEPSRQPPAGGISNAVASAAVPAALLSSGSTTAASLTNPAPAEKGSNAPMSAESPFPPYWRPALIVGGGLMLLLLWFIWLLRMRNRVLRQVTTVPSQNPAGYVVVTPRSLTGDSSDRAETRRAQLSVQIESPGPTHTESAPVSRLPELRPLEPADPDYLSRAGLLRTFSNWMKHTLVRKLMFDRAELLATQQEAALKARRVEERLAKIETHIQTQQQAYQRRIEELTRELLVAREENREMIRARIADIKREMEAARARALAEADADEAS